MKQTLLILFLSLTLRLSAPVNNCLVVPAGETINPYLPFAQVIRAVESDGNDLAWNLFEDARGPFQIRAIRLQDYIQETGDTLSHDDMFIYAKALKVYLHYAVKLQPWEYEKIARTWNGGNEGMRKKATLVYWRKVQGNLNENQ